MSANRNPPPDSRAIQASGEILASRHCNEKDVTRSRQEQEVLKLLKAKTVRVEVNGRYATPLLRQKDMPTLQASKESVMQT